MLQNLESMKRIFLLICLLFLSNCARISYKGYDLKEENLIELKKGLTSLENTYNLFGEPSYKISENVWMYYSYTTSQRAFLRPRVKEEDIIIVFFDENNTISQLFKVKNKNPKFSFKSNTTKQHKKDSSFFEDLFKGIQINRF